MRRLICLLFGHDWQRDADGTPSLSMDHTLFCVRCRRMYDVG